MCLQRPCRDTSVTVPTLSASVSFASLAAESGLNHAPQGGRRQPIRAAGGPQCTPQWPRRAAGPWRGCICVIQEEGAFRRRLHIFSFCLKQETALGRMARELSCLEHHPLHRRVAGSIPGHDGYVDCGFHPRSGYIWDTADGGFFLT